MIPDNNFNHEQNGKEKPSQTNTHYKRTDAT